MSAKSMHATDRAWERYGATDPYYGVIAHDDFRCERLDDATRDRFFEAGDRHVGWVLATARRLVNPQWTPTRALDFGCGVGRHVVPLAGVAQRVTAVDVSTSMLAETRRNCEARGIRNVDFVLSDDILSRLEGTFDLVHSYIVFQHIPRRRGMRLIDGLIDRLEPGGVGALHVLHAGRSRLRHAAAQIAGRIPGIRHAVNARRPNRRASDPPMQMNPYDLNALAHLLHSKGIRGVEASFTKHGHGRGIVIFFRKSPAR